MLPRAPSTSCGTQMWDVVFFKTFFKTARFSAIPSHLIRTAKFEKLAGPICCLYMRCDFESEPMWNHFFRQHHEFNSSDYLFLCGSCGVVTYMSHTPHHMQHHAMRTMCVVAFGSLFVVQIQVQVFRLFCVLQSQTKPFFVLWSKLVSKF